MSIIIEFCTNNSYFGTDKVLSTLEDRFDCEVVEYGCLTSCGQCYLMPFAYVDGEWVEAPTAEELLEVIVQKLESFQENEDKS